MERPSPYPERLSPPELRSHKVGEYAERFADRLEAVTRFHNGLPRSYSAEFKDTLDEIRETLRSEIAPVDNARNFGVDFCATPDDKRRYIAESGAVSVVKVFAGMRVPQDTLESFMEYVLRLDDEMRAIAIGHLRWGLTPAEADRESTGHWRFEAPIIVVGE